MERFLWICLAGALGTGVRYLIGLWADDKLGTSFPHGTLIVNIAGCFCMGLAMQATMHATSASPTLRLVLTTGFLGGLTTYSSFNYETTRLVQSGAHAAALVNVVVTFVACFVAGIGGLLLARRLFGE